jgi:hypothetical protein
LSSARSPREVARDCKQSGVLSIGADRAPLTDKNRPKGVRWACRHFSLWLAIRVGVAGVLKSGCGTAGGQKRQQQGNAPSGFPLKYSRLGNFRNKNADHYRW